MLEQIVGIAAIIIIMIFVILQTVITINSMRE